MRNPIKTNMVKDVSEPLVFCPLTLCVSRQRCNTFSDEKRDHQTNLINIESQHPCLVLNRVYVIQIGSLREITLSFVETIVTKRMKLMCKRYRTEIVWPINVLPNVSVKKIHPTHLCARTRLYLFSFVSAQVPWSPFLSLHSHSMHHTWCSYRPAYML